MIHILYPTGRVSRRTILFDVKLVPGTFLYCFHVVCLTMNLIHSFSLPAGYSQYSHHQPAAEGPPACPCTGPTAGQDRRRAQPR